MEKSLPVAVALFPNAAYIEFQAAREILILYVENPGSACSKLIQDSPHVASSTAVRFRVAVWSGQSPKTVEP
jgi:hypothetical protein